MFADELRRAIEAAPGITLPSVTALMWRACGDGQISEAEAEALAALIEARRVSPRSGENPTTGRDARSPVPGSAKEGCRKPAGARPVSGASLERRRRWAASGRMPPAIAARFTLGEQAVMAVVAAETARRGCCRLAIEHAAALAGVSRSTVKNALREARRLGLVTVEERKVTHWRNLPNVVRVVSAEWLAWLRLARQSPPLSKGGGVKCATGTHTKVLDLEISRPGAPSQGLPGGSGRPRRRARSGIVADGGAGECMR